MQHYLSAHTGQTTIGVYGMAVADCALDASLSSGARGVRASPRVEGLPLAMTPESTQVVALRALVTSADPTALSPFLMCET